MNEWMRNQFMAPVYALVISFVTSLLLGAVLVAVQVEQPTGPDPTTDVPDRTEPGVKFVTSRDGEVKPVAELRNVAVEISRIPSGDLIVGGDGVLLFSEVKTWLVKVCVALPVGWKAENPQSVELVNGRTCWELPDQADVASLAVKQGG